MKNLIVLISCFAGSLACLAQNTLVSGRVMDTAGNPLANVSITARGNVNGASTRPDGSFSIAVPQGTKIVQASSVGYASQEVPLTGSDLQVVLSKVEKQLEAVVVVAYGIQKRKEITSAISTVNAEAIRSQQVTTVAQALQGTASGVVVVNSSGQPGSNPVIRIRGIASVNAAADPLIVLDGIPYQGNLNMISPTDIDNFSVLKDATATVLYGSRAANGVILINTKSGKRNAVPVINVTAVRGYSSRAVPEYPFLNTRQHFELGWEALRNHYGTDPNAAQRATENLVRSAFHYNPYGTIPNPVDTTGKLVAGATPLWNTDWVKELQRESARRTNVNLGISGGTDKTRYFIGGEYLNQEGYVITSKYERVSARFNFTSDLKDWLQLGIRSSIVSSNQNYPDEGSNSYTDVILYSRTLSSVFPLYKRGESGELLLDAKGQPIFDYGVGDPSRTVNVNRLVLTNSNDVATTYLDKKLSKRLLVNLNTYADIKLAKGLSFRSSFGIDRYTSNSSEHDNKDFGFAVNVGGRTTRTSNLTTSWTWNNLLSYQHNFGDHNLNLMASYEAFDYKLEAFSGSKTGFPFGGLDELSNAATNESLYGSTTSETLLSYLARAKYDYKGKYFAEFAARRDGSSRFAPNQRYGFFPAGGVSWLLSQENFLKGSSHIDMLKIRASYGIVGNNQLVSYFPYLGTFATGYDELTNPGLYFDQLANENIRWERQGNTNVGVDFEGFNSRLTASLDLFNKSSIDLLFNLPLVYSGGIGTIAYNIGKIENKGVELSLGYDILKTRDLTWNISLNATWLKNTIRKLTDRDTLAPSGNQRLTVGHSRYEFYLADWAGVDPADGKPMWYVDELGNNGQPTGKRITTKVAGEAANGRKYFGSGIPKFTGGLSQRLSYRHFDVNLLLNYAFGGKYYDNNYVSLMHGFFAGYGAQLHTDILDRWQKPGDITNVPSLNPDNGDVSTPSNNYLFSGDYVRLRNVTLGYSVQLPNQQVIRSVRFFIQGDNLLTWDKLKKGSDPEANIDGNSNGNSNVYKTISGGLELTF
jgi:TonB-linked SusC/RagA family outer membrane protein